MTFQVILNSNNTLYYGDLLITWDQTKNTHNYTKIYYEPVAGPANTTTPPDFTAYKKTNDYSGEVLITAGRAIYSIETPITGYIPWWLVWYAVDDSGHSSDIRHDLYTLKYYNMN